MNYSSDPSMVRVDFFTTSGKWYTTDAVKWLTYDGKPVNEAFREALENHLRKEDGTLRLAGMTAICLDPFHCTPYPQMTTV